MKEVILQKGREKSVLRRHPWIFSGAIAKADESAAAGEIVCVKSAKGEILGQGAYSPASQIRVRLLEFGADAAFSLARVLRERVAAALSRRTVPAHGARRLVNAENDGLPGIVVDDYAGYLVCQLTSAGAEAVRDSLFAALQACLPTLSGISVRNDLDVRRKEGLPTEPRFETCVGTEPLERIEIEENGLVYLVDVRKGHKTGFYLDQREARRTVGALAKGRTVLNCFCYTGGFGHAAAQGGAAHVVQVDVSRDALALGAEIAGRNGLSAVEEFVEADVFAYLRTCRDAGRKFDLIVLDPPKFAETKSQALKAARGYKDINLLAMKLLAPGGILATFSCSGAMTSEFFDTILREAATDARRDFQIVARTRQAPDHPVALNFPEGLYLKGVILRAFS